MTDNEAGNRLQMKMGAWFVWTVVVAASLWCQVAIAAEESHGNEAAQDAPVATDAKPRDLTAVPLPAKKVVISAAAVRVAVPAPEGFWSLNDDDPIAKMLKVGADSDKVNNTLGSWVRTENGEWDDLQEAFVTIVKSMEGRTFPLSSFAKARDGVMEMVQESEGKVSHVSESMANSASREFSSLFQTNVNVSADNFRCLRPHLDKEDRIGYTMICREILDLGGETNETFSVVSSATIWIRGVIFSLSLSCTVPVDEKAVEAAVAATREKLGKWLESVDVANHRLPLEVEDFVARPVPRLADKSKSLEPKSYLRLGRMIMLAIACVFGIVSALRMKRKQHGEEEKTENRPKDH